MDNATLSAMQFGGLGAAGGLFLLVAGLLWRDRGNTVVGRLATLLALGAAAGAVDVAHTRLFPSDPALWQAPLLVLGWGSPAAFWLWACAAFDDEFVPRRWHAALWAAMPAVGLLITYQPSLWPHATRIGDAALPYAALGFALAVATQTLTTWAADLVAARLRLRIVVLIAACAYIAADAWLTLAPPAQGLRSAVGAAEALGLGLLALLAGWSLLRIPAASLAAPPVAVAAPDARAEPDAGAEPADPAVLRRLEHLMRSERAYREEKLTIGTLAARMKLPEYRLRQTINEGLGHRNFNAFLNSWRLADAKAALADPTQSDVPVLTIAMDAGFQSIGPFNRAFKADTGMTLTEYRRRPPIADIGQPV